MAGSWGYVGGNTYATVDDILGTSDDAIYQAERWWYGNGKYQFDVPNGSYQVTLRFAEIYYGYSGARKFDVRVQGTTILSNFEVLTAAGGKYRPFDKTVTATVSDGRLVIDLISRIGSPKINAIEVLSAGGGAPATATATPTATATSGSAGTPTNTATPAATATPTNTPLPTATATPTAIGGIARRVNAGGPAYADGGGNVWSADQAYLPGGWGYLGSGSGTYTTAAAISGSSNGALYQSERWGMSSYRFSVPNGSYRVSLKFAEIYAYAYPGSRIFDVLVEGTTVLPGLDILGVSGGRNRALDYTYTTAVSDGVLAVDFVRRVGNAKIGAIEVTSVGP